MMVNSEMWIVAITAGRWQKHGIQEAQKIGIKVVAIDSDPNAEGFKEADKSICIDINDFEAVIVALRALRINIQGAVSFCSDAGMLLAAYVREQFDILGPRTKICRSLIDKGIQRQIWEKAGVPSPKYRIFNSKETLLSCIPAFGFPSIIKPTDSSGSRGVTKLESIDDDLIEAVDHAFYFSKSGEVLLETYMVGQEFTVEVFCEHGKVITLSVTEKKKVAGTRGTVASELATPDRSPDLLLQITNSVADAFLALGYENGPGHAEVILMDDNSVGLIEVAGRGGGFMVFDKFVPLTSGVNIAKLTCLQALGLPLGPIKVVHRPAVLRFFPSQEGKLLDILGFDDANKVSGVEAGCFVNPGDSFGSARSDGDRLGFILSSATTIGDAQLQADIAERKVTFKFA
jgi:biotin carboxylase